MYFKSKNFSSLILGVSSLICSRVMFSLFDDPEGPNLLIVVVMALIIYGASLAVYSWNPTLKGVFQFRSPVSPQNIKSLLVVVSIQILVATVFYLLLK